MAKKNEPVDVFKSIDMEATELYNDKANAPCWPWKGKINAKDNRPYITIAGKRRAAYIVVLELHTGESAKGRMALHSCDNSICCNPHHLRWGTHAINMEDMKERERHGLPKIVVRAIRKLLKEKRTHKEIAELYGVTRETVTAINTGRSHND